MMDVGVSVVDITPPEGLAMAGFAARTAPAKAIHDRLTVRALVVDDTALVTVDVIGIDAALSKRVRQRCVLPAEAVTIVATHTHGGPVSMEGRLANTPDGDFMKTLEAGLVAAIDAAVSAKAPARLFGGTGDDPGFAKNRRHAGGPVDRGVPILRFEDQTGAPIAILVSYACHPVVLGADNLCWTGDYVHFVRDALEAADPGVTAIFATGCAGDVNTGHSAAASLSKAANPDRSFTAASAIGIGLAHSVAAARLSPLGTDCGAGEAITQLNFALLEDAPSATLAALWRRQADADPEQGDIFHIWAAWADNTMGRGIDPIEARCTALHWGGAEIVAMPGEIFADTALDLRHRLNATKPVFLLAYGDDNPGYIPPSGEFAHGGYEVEQAHRFYGLGATFAPGSAERLADAGWDAAQIAARAANTNQQPTITATEGNK